MSATTGIEWTDASWNPIVGCSVVSPGCKLCYAMKFAGARLAHTPAYKGLTQKTKAGRVWTGEVRQQESALEAPLGWRKAKRIFVNSMGDLFHEKAPDAWIDRVFAVMARCPQHKFQALTKRAERMRRYMEDERTQVRVAELALDAMPVMWTWPLPNVWLGVSAEDQERWDERVPHLYQTPAAVRFVSAEPLLGAITEPCFIADLDWVIVGGESGSGARPMHPDWARGLRAQCAAHGVPFFFKQWGDWVPYSELAMDVPSPLWRRVNSLKFMNDPKCTLRGDVTLCRVGKKLSGRRLDARTHDEFPGERARAAA